MLSSYTEISIILLLLVCNGILAMTEIAMISARKGRLREWADNGDKSARLALDIANSPTDFLSTVQIGITLVGIFAGAFAGSTIAEELADYVKGIPLLATSADALGMGIVVTVITYFSLILGELVPKRLALNAPERIARAMAAPMLLLSSIAKPIVILLSASTGLVLSVLGSRGNNDPSVTEAEIHIMVEQATKAGVVEESEQEMVSSVMRLGDRKVTSIMTHRTEVVWIDIKTREEQLVELLDSSSHAWFPVAKESLDNVLGVVESKAIMRLLVHRLPIELDSILVQPAYVPENTSALELLERFRETKHPLAIVVDEYGGLLGLVSRDDIFEAIVGDLPTHSDVPKWEAHQREDGSWLLDGQMPLEDFSEILSVDIVLTNELADYHTLAGFVLHQLRRIPQVGESFTWHGIKFEIVDMDRHRIDKVLVKKSAT